MTDFLVIPQWLSKRLDDETVRIVDGSWYLPAQSRDARAEFHAGHIPGAVFFDIDAVTDRSTTLPHMLPSPEEFSQAVGALGISENDTIVVYDGMGLFSAPRVWWTFRAFGARDVRILDGGLPAWVSAGLPLQSGDNSPAPRRFRGLIMGEVARSADEVRAVLEGRLGSVVDARPAGRFRGETPEPRPGLRSGHMPGARNLPADRIVGPDGKLVAPKRLRALFEEAGVDLEGPITTTCGSGVTAAALVFALATLGREDVGLYDGSWAEWGGRDDLPVATGAQ